MVSGIVELRVESFDMIRALAGYPVVNEKQRKQKIWHSSLFLYHNCK